MPIKNSYPFSKNILLWITLVWSKPKKTVQGRICFRPCTVFFGLLQKRVSRSNIFLDRGLEFLIGSLHLGLHPLFYLCLKVYQLNHALLLPLCLALLLLFICLLEVLGEPPFTLTDSRCLLLLMGHCLGIRHQR